MAVILHSWLAIYVLLINLLGFCLCGFDKRSACRGGQRVPERILLHIALIGATPGIYAGMRIFRHKTRKQPFKSRFWLIVLLQGCALLYLFFQQGA